MAFRATLPRSAVFVARLAIVAAVLALALAGAYLAFLWFPTDAIDLVGIVLVVAIGVAGLRLGGSLASWAFPTYNVAEVAVEGPITRDGGGFVPSPPGHMTADEIADQIDRADGDPAVQGLLVKLNTPGGEVLPSDDIRLAVEEFDGPAVAYATDTCASGGYWIASGCDELWARDASVIGSIGVRGSTLNVSELADRLGIEHERFTAGRYKDAGSPFRDMEDHEREYLQGLIDDIYDRFLERVERGRDLDREELEETEARVYLGEEAHELGLVDAIGTDEDARDSLGERLDLDDVRIQPFQAERPITQRLRVGTERLAFALGAGMARHLVDDEVPLPGRR